jgi:hypothetical protein
MRSVEEFVRIQRWRRLNLAVAKEAVNQKVKHYTKEKCCATGSDGGRRGEAEGVGLLLRELGSGFPSPLPLSPRTRGEGKFGGGGLGGSLEDCGIVSGTGGVYMVDNLPLLEPEVPDEPAF